MNNNYQCCFCGNAIKSNKKLGVTGLVVVMNWDKDREEQQEQQLFCHMDCLKNRMDSKVPLYLADLID